MATPSTVDAIVRITTVVAMVAMKMMLITPAGKDVDVIASTMKFVERKMGMRAWPTRTSGPRGIT
eukprot:2837437-Pyramimonas_sp.AAC.1